MAQKLNSTWGLLLNFLVWIPIRVLLMIQVILLIFWVALKLCGLDPNSPMLWHFFEEPFLPVENK